jgi:hypothetical protein
MADKICLMQTLPHYDETRKFHLSVQKKAPLPVKMTTTEKTKHR